MRILGINGSPRKRGHTVELLEVALNAARERGTQTHLIHLADYEVRRCRGSYTCAKTSCPLQDDMPQLLADIRALHAEGLLYGAPVFNFNLPGLLIDFWNRKTGLSGYHKARETGTLDEWLRQNRA